VSFKIEDKYEKQEKDSGIKFLEWSIKGSQDYLGYLRGDSTVKIFDTQTEQMS